MSDADQLLTVFWIVLGVLISLNGVTTATGAIDPAFFGIEVPVSVAVLWHCLSAMLCFYLASPAGGVTLGDLTGSFKE